MPCINSIPDNGGNLDFFLDGEIADMFKKSHGEFDLLYRIQDVRCDGKESYDKFIPKDKRTCIFCGLSFPDTSFKSEAHLIPKCIGNQRLLSYRECDKCNNHFKNIEEELVNYLGVKRLNSIASQKKVAPPRSNFKISRNDTSGLSLEFLPVKVNAILDGDILHLPFRTRTYRLLNLWKVMAKVALSLMPQEDLKNYSGLIRFLFDDSLYTHESHYKKLYTVYIHDVKGRINTPMAILYKKRQQEIRSLTHTFQLYFCNEVWQIFLPMNDNDDFLYDGINPISHVYCPPTLINDDYLRKMKSPLTFSSFFANTKIDAHRFQSVKLPALPDILSRDIFNFITPDNISQNTNKQ